MENTASVISAIDADVVALCEVENGNALKQLKNALAGGERTTRSW